MFKVCLTNDDGPLSEGLLHLAGSLSKKTDLTVIIPDGQRSATGKALTLNRPLRATDHGNVNGYRKITHDGTPADSVVISSWFVGDIDLFVSGINAGANLGYQSMLTSGTVGAVFEAALKGYPAIAISVEAAPHDWFNNEGSFRNYSVICEVSMKIIMSVLEEGLPSSIDALNLNFPCEIDKDTIIEITRPARVRMGNEVVERKDPHNRVYFWLKGVEMQSEQGSDVYAVLVNNNISLSPIVIDGVDDICLDELSKFRDL